MVEFQNGGEYPLVSAVVTTHNRKALVVKAIESVISQDYPNMELIVVDDQSSDGSKEMLEQLSRQQGFTYIYIPPEESKGGNYARNQGIRNSKGKYIAFLDDDDDEWLPGKIKCQVDFLETHSECGVVATFRIIEKDYSKRSKAGKVQMIEGDARTLIFERIPFVTSVAMYRRSILEMVGMFDENLGYWQETELNMRVAQVAEFGMIHDELCLYRMITTDKNRLTNHMEGWEKAIQYIRKKHSKIIKQLPKHTLRKFNRLIARDGYYRAKSVGNKLKQKNYLIKFSYYDKDIKGLVKTLIGERCYEILKKIKARFARQ